MGSENGNWSPTLFPADVCGGTQSFGKEGKKLEGVVADGEFHW